jgi:hypothetical protein
MKEDYEILKIGLFSSLSNFGFKYKLFNHLHLYTEPKTLFIDLLSMISDFDESIRPFFDKTLDLLFSGIPLLMQTTIKTGSFQTLLNEVYGDTYADESIINEYTTQILLRKIFLDLKYMINGIILENLTLRLFSNKPKIVLLGYGEYILDYITNELNLERILISSILRNKYLSIYATSIGPIIDYLNKLNLNIDVNRIEIMQKSIV